jgi:putative Mg2+ transporter-C (MgtC) family protein
LLEQPTFPRLVLALLLGAIIGAERQWRQRAAGIRTNTLVCLGAAAFVDLGSIVSGSGVTGVIAYVISGVGFLGAGAIMKEGGGITGLNTAATLWCSAAVGACAGAGEMLDAVFVTVLLMGINLVLRPVSRYIDTRALTRAQVQVMYRIRAICDADREAEVRSSLLRALAESPMVLREILTESVDDTKEVSIQAVVESSKKNQTLIEKITGDLAENPAVSLADWAETSLEGE